MKSGTIPYPRQFTVGDSGIDCRAVKRALTKWLGSSGGMSTKTLTFGRQAGTVLGEFKKAQGLLSDPIYTVQAHTALLPFFDEFGAAQMAKKAASINAAAQRTAYVHAWEWVIEHNSECDYAETRPIPLWLAPYETSNRIVTDCSGMVTLMAKWAGLADPNGFAFDGQGNTGTILSHCALVTQKQAIPGDLVVYRSSPYDAYGHHVCAILGFALGGDFELGSNGHQGDPTKVLHSVEAASQAGMGYPTVTFKRWLPVP